MKSFKNHFSVIFPLVALLVSIQFIFLVVNLLSDYEKKINKDYSIIIVSANELKDANLRPLVYTFESLEELSPKAVLDKLAKDISAKNISVLQNALPKFYSLKLNAFPSMAYMQELREKISKIEGVSRVETFAKTHNKIYKILQLIKNISSVFSALIVIVGLMLITKQMQIWLYEHKERIDIMSLLGAPSWLKAGNLYKNAVFDSFVASFIVVAFYVALPDFEIVKESAQELNIALPAIDMVTQGGTLLGISLALSLFAVYIVMRRARTSV